MDGLTCWKCGGPLAGVPLPLGRSAECPRCRAELRVCRQCEFYDPQASRECREPQAEPGPDKERATFCDWFRPRHMKQSSTGDAADQARAGLEALFGSGGKTGSPQKTDEARKALDQLFRKK